MREASDPGNTSDAHDMGPNPTVTWSGWFEGPTSPPIPHTAPIQAIQAIVALALLLIRDS